MKQVKIDSMAIPKLVIPSSPKQFSKSNSLPPTPQAPRQACTPPDEKDTPTFVNHIPRSPCSVECKSTEPIIIAQIRRRFTTAMYT
jgi:hypothetical protein